VPHLCGADSVQSSENEFTGGWPDEFAATFDYLTGFDSNETKSAYAQRRSVGRFKVYRDEFQDVKLLLSPLPCRTLLSKLAICNLPTRGSLTSGKPYPLSRASGRQQLLPVYIPRRRLVKGRVRANWLPWSVLKISGRPWRLRMFEAKNPAALRLRCGGGVSGRPPARHRGQFPLGFGRPAFADRDGALADAQVESQLPASARYPL